MTKRSKSEGEGKLFWCLQFGDSKFAQAGFQLMSETGPFSQSKLILNDFSQSESRYLA